MPTKEESEAKALEYAALVSAVEKLRIAKEGMEAELATNKSANDRLVKQIEEATEAFDRLHKEVLSLEKELEEKRTRKLEEIENEDRRLAAEREQLTEAVKQNGVIADTIKQREDNVLSREMQIKDRETMIEQKQRALTDATFELEQKSKEADATMLNATTIKNEAKKQLDEAGEKLRAAKAAESNAKSAQEAANRDATKASDDQLQAAADKRSAEEALTKNEKMLNQVQIFTKVAQEDIDYIAAHVGNNDAILNYYATKYPELASELTPENPKAAANPGKVAAATKAATAKAK